MSHKKYLAILLFFLTGLLTLTFGCKKDKVSINRLPDITIGAVTITEKSIGDTVTIVPDVGYGGQAANFSFKWYKYITLPNYSQVLKLVSQKPTFVMPMDSLGTYQLREEVTNLNTGITAATILSWNVVSRAERGWYVLKGTADGNTDMDAFLTSPKGSATTVDIITAKYGQSLPGNPVALAFTSVYSYLNPVNNGFITNNSCLMPMSSKEVLAYRIKDERVLASSNQLFYEVPPAASRNYQALVSDPKLMVLVNNGSVQGMNPASNSFLPPRTGDYFLSPYFTTAPYATTTDASYVLGFDQKNESFVTVRYQQSDVSYFPNVYLNKSGAGKQYNIPPNNMGGKMVFMENMDGSLDTLLTTNARAYALLKKDNSNEMWLLGLNIPEIIPTRYNGAHSPIRYADTLSYARFPELTSASFYALNKNNPILYYTNGNKISSYNIDTKTLNDNIYSFSAGEEITYIKFINCQYDTPATYNFTNLVVATYTNGSYKIYRFNVLGNSLIATGTVFTGTGRVKSLIYTTPNISTFFNSMYRYY